MPTHELLDVLRRSQPDSGGCKQGSPRPQPAQGNLPGDAEGVGSTECRYLPVSGDPLHTSCSPVARVADSLCAPIT